MSKNKILLVKGIAGLGNRILCLLTGILYARLTDRRLIVDWSDHYYSTDGSNVFHRYFQCPITDPTDEIPTTDSVNPSIWRGRLSESAWYLRKHQGKINDSKVWQQFSIDLNKLDYDEDILVMWTYDEKVDLLRPHFNGKLKEFKEASTEEILKKLLKEYLSLHTEIQGRIARFKENNFDGKCVGVHIRFTDHRSNIWAILTNLNALLSRAPGLQIFLSTDNLQIKDMFEKLYPGVITAPHWYSPTPGLTIHNNRRRPDPYENGIEALIDLYLMSECEYMIIDTSSSFSYIAKLLSKAPDSRIFDVGSRGKLPPFIRSHITRLMLKLGFYTWGINLITRAADIRRRLIR